MKHKTFMLEAIALAKKGMRSGQGGPFGAVVVKDEKIVGRGWNQVTSSNDPTAHAEVMAIRDACSNLKTFQLEDCIIYTSCEPCPMCLGAIYWARPKHFYYASSRKEAAAIDFDDEFIYEEINILPEERSIPAFKIDTEEARTLFNEWKTMEDRTEY